jgi:hypothetical protein
MAIWERLKKQPQLQAIPTRELSLTERYFGFPEGLTYDRFVLEPEATRKAILANNPITRTDAYNRTMEHISGEKAAIPGTYVLQFRKADEGYLITAGIEDTVKKLADTTVTQSMLDFAKEYYEHAGFQDQMN